MPRVKLFDQQEALKKAMELFWEKGYESTSLIDLTEHLGIGKGSFYATFKSKENLFNQCIEAYTASNLPYLDLALKSEENFKVSLHKLLDGYVEGLLLDDKRKGCLMANSCALIDGENAEIGDKILAHYEQIEAFLTQYMEKEGVDPGKAGSVSAMIITFLIGASQQSKVNRNKEGYLTTVKNIISLLD